MTVVFDGRPPNVLVLGGGGLLGEAWITGVLAGYRDATGADPRRCRRFVGTSAGSIVAASLAAGREPRRDSLAHAAAAAFRSPFRVGPIFPPDRALPGTWKSR